jgi:hypothetical protein
VNKQSNQKETVSNSFKINEDSNLRIDIDDIFSKFSHLANYSTHNIPSSHEETMENPALLSDGSLSPALEEAESPIDSKFSPPFSGYNDSDMLKKKPELTSYQTNNELNLSNRALNDKNKENKT